MMRQDGQGHAQETHKGSVLRPQHLRVAGAEVVTGELKVTSYGPLRGPPCVRWLTTLASSASGA